ncbi:hypothetical protein BK120_10190 [Paenibacillus sp. FSL A5-0031]|uniref:hypothetical protein n=1 Tax=unclassified Paenibacillus TaxID=185978 RepID=UPI00096CD79B|nr:hypothetical protein [Paenibacillus sp. FSL A5-0031]OME86314.1 hypothetical protein BK120_10190 [Paenibacillus sp. FSL A5-0031]
MSFYFKLRTYLGRDVEVILSNGDVVAGVLLTVGFSYIVVRTLSVPGYGGTEDVLIRLRVIEYVRIL